MNNISKRNFKNKIVSKPNTLKETFLRKDSDLSKTIPKSENVNESFVDVFKFHEAKETKTRSALKEMKSKSDDSFDELFSDFKSKPESSKEDNPHKSDDSFSELFSDFKAKIEANGNRVDLGINYDEKDFTVILRDNLSPNCPICFKKNNYDSEAIYISHLKKCAYKNKMSMEQLKRALELQHKQTSERVALGLPVASKERRPRKFHQNKGPMDSNLELGIALSTSLREYDTLNKLQEKEVLIQAGIEPETFSQYRNLEDYGFASNKPAENVNFRGHKRCKNPPRNTVLFTRSKEERERIITEKVAILLIDGDSQSAAAEIQHFTEPFTLKSKYLNQYKDDDATLWKKSYQISDDFENMYYVSSLRNFVSPCKVPVGAKLRHLSQIPCRPPSPEKPSTFKHLNVGTSSQIEKPPAVKNLIKKLEKPTPTVTINPKFRQDWKYMLNKNILSDLIIYAKNEVPIFAHKLVFYARCRSILTETIEEMENNKKNEMLMWMEYSFEAIMTFLEYIYTGSLPDLGNLGDLNKKDLRALCIRYEFKDIVETIDRSEEAQMFVSNEDDDSPLNRKVSPMGSPLPFCKPITPVEDQCDEFTNYVALNECNSSPKNIAIEMTEGEKNLQMMMEAMKTQNLRSPEMFEDDSEPENLNIEEYKSQNNSIVEDMLSKLCSPVQSPHSAKEEIKLTCSSPPEIDLTLEFDSDKKTTDKRKSFSPLEKSIVKKPKTTSRKRKSRELPLSQVLCVSDTSEVSDSDESLYKVKITRDVFKCDDKNSSASSFDKMDSKELQQSDFERTPTRCVDNIDSKHVLSSTCKKTNSNEPSPRCSDSIWEGFDDLNNMHCDYNDFLGLNAIPLNSPLRSLNSSTFKAKSPIKKSNHDSLFGSFHIEEDALSKIEIQAMAATATQKPMKSSTPDSVRKFHRRSKSENSLTPVNKCTWNTVTPMADYSSMKNDDLKKELEKYGIKPGLSRNKAKMMLKFIYEQLHPFEEESNGVERKDAEINSNSNHNADSGDSSDSETSGISLLEETYVEDIPEVCSQDVENSKTKVDVHTGFTNLLRDDKSLHKKILLYEPIWLESLKTTLKNYGVRCSTSELMNYLDEKCITFRTQQQKVRRKKLKKSIEEKRPSKKRSKNTRVTVDI